MWTFPGLISGESISPDQQKVRGKEGESVTLRCTYETSSNGVHLYWYSHRSNQAPQFILYKGARSWSNEHIPDRRYQSTTSRTSTELTITQVTLADSALYYCALRTQWYKVWRSLYINPKARISLLFKEEGSGPPPHLSIRWMVVLHVYQRHCGCTCWWSTVAGIWS